MSATSDSRNEGEDAPSQGGVAETLRAAVERTMRATAGSAATSRERATELVDEVVKRGLEARDQLARRGQEAGDAIARRGQEAGVELARRGQEATGEVSRRLELLETRLAELESRLETDPPAEPGEPRPVDEANAPPASDSERKPEG
jgi:polyhydroxyalkanoate synthesis regulator phasin